MKKHKTIKCDKCHREIAAKDSWVSWYWNHPKKQTSSVFLTCHPSQCSGAAMIEDECKDDDMLMDMYAPVIAERFVSWATDYKIGGDTVANMAVRILPLLMANDQ